MPLIWTARAAAAFLVLSLSIAIASRADPLDVLAKAYPEALSGHDAQRIFWRDGTAMAVSDGRGDKSFEEKLRNASILDQLSLPYPRGPLAAPPAVNDDPGRFRDEAFFLKIYGDCRRPGFAANLAPVIWLPNSWGRRVMVTKINGVADRLREVSAEIDGMPQAVKRAAYPIAGVLACRPVADTGRLSMHAYAAAIDLNLDFSDYWLWHRSGASGTIPYRNRMPPEIVAAFERHGFIWGGKWYHYDTMHFEYRPELLGGPAD
ncbi:MAG TPA: M15 family metallopeptidase [Stellaceae bacterium]|nr:M15 family metallopeptidase [Stellaceae bacterium]